MTINSTADIKVSVIGCINDQKFTTNVSGQTDAETGLASISLTYSNIPPLWHPFNYSDPLVLLADYREVDDAGNFRSLARRGFLARCTIDFGYGLLLRKTADIRWDGNWLLGGYAIWGSACCPDIVEAEPYEEFMHPIGNGVMLGIGTARWRRASGEIVEACVSTHYKFDEPRSVLSIPQIRHVWPKLLLSGDGLTVEGEYETAVWPMARRLMAVELDAA